MTRNSKDKLNAVHLVGAIAIGALVAVASGSWVLFLFVAGGLILASLATGEIRLPNRRK